MALHSTQSSPVQFRLLVKLDRRRAPRLEVVDWLYDVRGELLSNDAPVVLRDLGAGGFAVESSMAIPAGVQHQFRFTAEDGETFVITATSRHTAAVGGESGARYLTGFEFLRQRDLSAADPVVQLLTKIELALCF